MFSKRILYTIDPLEVFMDHDIYASLLLTSTTSTDFGSIGPLITRFTVTLTASALALA